jgi:hypothetical protein
MRASRGSLRRIEHVGATGTRYRENRVAGAVHGRDSRTFRVQITSDKLLEPGTLNWFEELKERVPTGQ